METRRKGRRIRWALPRLLIALAAWNLLYFVMIRPWYLRWGATSAELARSWPGEELYSRPGSRSLRAITIEAAPETVWPWLMQIGRERGGFYSYTFLENLFGLDLRNTYHLVPGTPDRQAGDAVWLAPRDKFGGMAHMVVQHVEPPRSMVLVPPPGADGMVVDGKPGFIWSMNLDPAEANRSRLIIVGTGTSQTDLGAKLIGWFAMEPAHFIMEQKMMRTLRELAESGGRK